MRKIRVPTIRTNAMRISWPLHKVNSSITSQKTNKVLMLIKTRLRQHKKESGNRKSTTNMFALGLRSTSDDVPLGNKEFSPFVEAPKLIGPSTIVWLSFGLVALSVNIRGLPSSRRRCKLFLLKENREKENGEGKIRWVNGVKPKCNSGENFSLENTSKDVWGGRKNDFNFSSMFESCYRINIPPTS